MPIFIRDPHLEKLIKDEADRRGYGAISRTATALLIERLTQLEKHHEDTPLVRIGPGGEYVRDYPSKETK